MLYICMFDSEKLELLSKDLVHSIGIDIVDIRKIERIYNKYRERFLDHILTLEEQAQFDVYLKTYGLTQKFYQKLGNTWAAKEAVIKAMNGSVKMKSICVLRGSNGAPYVYLINHINGIQDGLKSIIDGRLIRELLCGKYLCTLNLKISMSDDYPYSMACCVVYKRIKYLYLISALFIPVLAVGFIYMAV